MKTCTMAGGPARTAKARMVKMGVAVAGVLALTACGALSGNSSSPPAAEATAKLPERSGTLAEALGGDPRFSTFAELAQSVQLEQELGSGEYTIFAPTNEAFQALPPGTLDQLRNDQQRLRSVIAQHVVQGQVLRSDEIPKQLEPAAGDPIQVALVDGKPYLRVGAVAGAEGPPPTKPPQAGEPPADQAAPPAPDQEVALGAGSGAAVEVQPLGFKQGVVHGIDQVLLPPAQG